MKLLNKIKYNNKGFSLIEILVVLTVISIGLLGVASLVLQNTQVQVVNKNYLLASMLAQEGIELVRNFRDTNWLITDADWQYGLDSDHDITQDGDFTIDSLDGIDGFVDDANIINDITDDDDARLLIDDDGYYNHTVGTVSPFFRLIKVDDVAAEYVTVESIVQWQDRGRLHEYIAYTTLYNWR